MDNSSAVWFWEKPSYEDRKTTFNTWLQFLGIFGFVIMLLVVLFSTSLSNLFFDTDKYKILFVLLGVNIWLATFQKIVNVWCRMMEKPFLAIFYSSLITCTTVGFNLLFVLKQHLGVVGVFYSQLIASVIGIIMLLVFFKKWISFSSFSLERLKEMFHFSLPLVPANLLYWVLNTTSVYFIKYFIHSNAEIGLYQVGASMASILSLITWAFFQAWTSFGLSVSKKPYAGKIYSLVLEIFCIFGMFVAFSLFLVSKDVLLIFASTKYVDAKYVIGIMAINVVLLGIPNILAIANSLTKKNQSYAVAIGIGTAVTVLSFLLLIPRYGKEGAALSILLGNLVVPVYLGLKAQKLYYIPYNFIKIILFVGLELLLFGISFFLFNATWMHFVSIIAIGSLIVYMYFIMSKNKLALLKSE